MNDQLQKRDAGKFDPLMIEEDLARALEVENAVLEFGKEKYGTRGGWMAVDMARYKSAGARHRKERMKTDITSRDDDTGLLHIAHEIINLQFQLEMHLRSMTPKQYAKELVYKKPIKPVVVNQAQQFQNVSSDVNAFSRKCPLTNETCQACPDSEVCRASFRGNRAPDWVKVQIHDQPDYDTPRFVDTGVRFK